jgi:heavy metal translocating P-type ATPase
LQYRITSDIPGRIRVRFGRYAFTEDFSRAAEDHFIGLNGVLYAQAAYRTGSLLIVYEGCTREMVLDELSGLGSLSLDFVPGTLSPEPLLDNAIKRQLKRMALKRVLIRYLFPKPVRVALSVFFALGYFRKGLAQLLKGRLNVDVLDASAVGAAQIQGDFDTASSIMFLLSVADLIEQHTLEKTRSALADSLVGRVEQVWTLKDGMEIQVHISELSLGDLVVVRAGGVIPVDGEVTDGIAEVNEVSMTGEPLPVARHAGNSVFAGTVVESGQLIVSVRKEEGETRIRRILDLIEHSESLKAVMQKKAEQLADKLVPYNFLFALLVLLTTRNTRKALSVLLVDYSCAIKLATPLAVLSAMREGARNGILLRGGKHLETLADVDTFVFDKTGTLTLAEPHVNKVVAFGEYTRAQILRTAACIEEHFPHSVARAIVRAAKEEDLRHDERHAEVQYIVAHGIATMLEGRRTVIGSRHFLFEDESVPLSKEHEELIDSETETVICLAIDGEFCGYLCVDDPVRTEASAAIAGLRRTGVKRIVMLTGDGEQTARKVADELGIDIWHAQLLPEDKVRIIEELRAAGHKVAMVGDGINDSPALAAADVSIAMSDASDLAREVADVTILMANLNQLTTARRLAQRLMRRIMNNYRFIIGFNTALVALGATDILSPGTSALLHNLSTIGLGVSGTRPLLAAPQEECKSK